MWCLPGYYRITLQISNVLNILIIFMTAPNVLDFVVSGTPKLPFAALRIL
jgi:hypothetical protein